MKKTIKLAALLLALALVFTIAGCGNESASSENSSVVDDDFFADEIDVDSKDENPANTESTESTSGSKDEKKQNKVGGKSWKEVLASMPKELRGTTIQMYNWNSAAEYSGAVEAIKNFEKATGITVKWSTINYDDYNSKLASLVASGQSPDVARTCTPSALGLQSFQPISVSGYDFSDDAWDKTLMNDYSINGKVYATSLKNTHIGGAIMMFYNKSLISKYDLDDPYKLWKNDKWTWSKFLDMCNEYIKESNAKFAAGANNWDNWAIGFGIRGPVGYDGKKYYNAVGTSDFLKVTQTIADLHNTSKLFKFWGAENFDKGECLFWSGHAIYGRRKNAYFASLKKAGTLYAVPMPKIDGQSKYYQGKGEYEAYAIPSGAKNAKAVPYFLRYFLDAENYDMSAFYCNKQIQEVYNWCMNQKNTAWSTYYSGGMAQTSKDKWSDIKNLPGSQIKSFIDSNSSAIDKRANDLNKAFNMLK